MAKKLRFSERIGVVKPRETFQIDSMSPELHNSLWNLLLRTVLHEGYHDQWVSCVRPIWADFHHLRLDEMPKLPAPLLNALKERFFEEGSQWYAIYELMQFIADNTNEVIPRRLCASSERFQYMVNLILEEHLSGYRFVNGMLVPVTSEEEIRGIEEAVQQARKDRLYGAQQHLQEALAHLTRRPDPECRGSIKESISAVEAVAKKLGGERGGGLHRPLAKLDEKVGFHKGFRRGLEQLYGYTCDAEGIRHAILERPNVGLDEAKFMLVMCSALVSYMIAKAHEHGLLS